MTSGSGDPTPVRVAVLTVSTSRASGEAADEGGPGLAAAVAGIGAELIAQEVVPDNWDKLAERLRHLADGGTCDLILTTGGTGFAPDDVTPEATRDVVEREAPGIAEAMRLASREHSRHWMLSRGVAGIRGRTLIINFPGSPKAIDETWQAIAGSVQHAVSLLRGDRPGHA